MHLPLSTVVYGVVFLLVPIYCIFRYKFHGILPAVLIVFLAGILTSLYDYYVVGNPLANPRSYLPLYVLFGWMPIVAYLGILLFIKEVADQGGKGRPAA